MVETQNIEYKESWRDEYLKWICGFANAQGGKIYIGINDDGKVVGVCGAKRLMEEIPNKIRDGMGIVVPVNLLERDGLPYIEIDVPSYPVGISYKGVYHYRSGTTKQVLNGPALEAFLLRRRGVTWDNLPLPAFRVEDVDDEVVKKFKKLAAKKSRIDPSLLDEPKETLLDKLRLTNAGYLTNAAALLFSADPDKYQLGSYIKIGFFETNADILYQDEIRGPLLDQVDKALDLIYFKYMKARISYEGAVRVERYFVPREALREALLNAICHKHYQSGTPIQVSVYEDRLYVANVGSLPEGWTSDNLLGKHSSRPYNPNIANAFFLAGFIESWGRGVEKICSALDADELPYPEYTIHPGDVMIKFVGPENRVIRASKRTDDKTLGNVRNNTMDQLSENERRTLEALIEDPGRTSQQIAETLSVARSSASRFLKGLKDKGLIERVGSDKTGRWKININRL